MSAVAGLTVARAQFRPPTRGDYEEWGVAGVDTAFVRRGAPGLSEWDTDAYDRPAEVWKAVVARGSSSSTRSSCRPARTASCAATAAPAQRASRIRPAAALRIAD